MSKIYIDKLTKGDNFSLQLTATKKDGTALNVTGYNIRAELYDKSGNSVKKANDTVTGGASTQIEVTNATNGIFIIHVLKTETASFNDVAYLEVEVENTDSPTAKYTIVRGEDTEIRFRDQKITWDDIS